MIAETSENERLIADSIAQLAAAHAGASKMRALRDAPVACDQSAWRALVDSGWLGLLIPESSGGAGLGLPEFTVFMEQVGRELMLLPVAPAMTAAHMLSRLAGAAGERSAELLSGERIWLPVWPRETTWPGDEPDALAVTKTPSGLVISGTLSVLPDAHWADGFLFEAQVGGAMKTVLLRSDAPGLSLSSMRTVDASTLGSLVCKRVAVPSEDLFDRLHDGDAVSLDGYRTVRIGVAAELVGLMDKALSMTVEYLGLRRQFRKPIGSFQAMQQLAASAYVDVQASRALVRESCVSGDGDRAQAAAAAAKARASDAALRVTKAAIQCHGAIGFADEHDIGLFLRRAMVLSGRYGNARVQRGAYLAARGLEHSIGR